MVDPRLIGEWLRKADEDFGFAASIGSNSPYHAQICFHFQQAAEKYLKAFIVAHELEFQKSHDLLGLLNVCLTKEPSLATIKEECLLLNRFYIDTRYPVHWPTNYGKEESSQAISAAGKIGAAVKALLGTQ